jgi:hypothetical protein
MNTGKSFIAHLVELHTRLLNAVVAVPLGSQVPGRRGRAR